MPECASAMKGVQQVLSNPVRLHGIRELLHDRPLVNIKLGGKPHEAVARNDSLGHLPFVILQVGRVRLVIVPVAPLLRHTQQFTGNGFDLPRIQIQK
jgi:hypothetical protein